MCHITSLAYVANNHKVMIGTRKDKTAHAHQLDKFKDLEIYLIGYELKAQKI